MYTIGYDSGGPGGEETMAIVKWYEDGSSELIHCGRLEDSPITVYSTPHEPRLLHAIDEMIQRAAGEIWRAVPPSPCDGECVDHLFSPIGSLQYPNGALERDLGLLDEFCFDPSIELCRTCYHTLLDCECEVGGNV